MPLLFRPKHNYLARLSLLLIAAGAGGGLAGLFTYNRSPVALGMQSPVAQPIQFDHRHHVQDEGIPCLFCHQTADKAPHAGLPSSQLCMNCHSQIWNGSPMLEKVRQSVITGQPIRWTKVNDNPDFVYFNHAIHVNKGVGCVSCHGRVDQMAAVQKAEKLTMRFCLDCHRNPEPNLRPRSEVTNMAWKPEGHDADLGAALADEYDVHTRTSCTTCHR